MDGVAAARKFEGTILYSTVGRTHYGFDIFSVSLPIVTISPDSPLDPKLLSETQLTDGKSVNFNGCFDGTGLAPEHSGDTLVYVSERNGCARLYWTGGSQEEKGGPECGALKGSVSKLAAHHQGLFYDRPCVAADKVYFVSTQEEVSGASRQCWTAVYCTSIDTGNSFRLTPVGVADFSPSVSPSGKWVAVASNQGRGWEGEIEDLHTDLYVFKAEDGSQRTLVAKNAGWPTWADDSTVFFHRKADDGWWSIYKITIPASTKKFEGPVEAERLTPPCVHAFTPAASRTGDWLAVATRRPDSKYRHIEIFHLASKEFIALTVGINPQVHHYNPFVSPSSTKIGYHRCRDGVHTPASVIPHLEVMVSPLPGISLLRIDGFFPSFSPCGRFIAYNRNLPGLEGQGLYVVRADGSKMWRVCSKSVFGTAWDMHRKGVIYSTLGPIFSPVGRTVQVVAVTCNLEDLVDSTDEVSSTVQFLTKEGTGNNAFPAPSPDGKEVVFRSGRNGYKNLYIMDAEKGEEGGIRQLTEGNWTDTMPHWSPDGQWIGFSRSCTAEGDFALYMVKPDGTQLHKVLQSGAKGGGRVNHVCFSPDSKSILFTSDLAGVSAEPISIPNQFQPYGELFVAKADGTEVVRLTHNAYEDGTPTWSSFSSSLSSSCCSSGGEELRGDFSDPIWLGQITEDMKGACCGLNRVH